MIKLRLKDVLNERGISQSKLSRLTDVSLNTIQLLYHNPHHNAVLSTLERLAHGLDVPIATLYEVEK